MMQLLRRSELFRTLIRQPVEFFDTAEVGVLTSRIGADCQAVVRCMSTNLNVALRNGMQCIGAALQSFAGLQHDSSHKVPN